MAVNKEKPHIFDEPRNVRRLLGLLYLACGLLAVADFWIHRHAVHPLEGLPLFYGIYGFVGCVTLVMAAKELRKLVMRREDYYDRD